METLGGGLWQEDEDRFTGRGENRNPQWSWDESRRWPGGERGFGFGGYAAYGGYGRGPDEQQAYARGPYGAEQGWGRDRWEGRGGEERQPGRTTQGHGGTIRDWRAGSSRGQYAGKGPKGYHRSDERVYEDVCDALTRDPEVDGTHIEVKVDKGIVTLTGKVEDRPQKRFAENVVERIEGVKDVHNQLRVEERQERAHELGTNLDRERAMMTGGEQTHTGRAPKGRGASERNA